MDGPAEMPASAGDLGMTRRDSVRVGAGGIIALAQCLGLPAALLAQESMANVELRYYRSSGNTSRLVYAEPLSSAVMEVLMSGAASELELKWYYGRHGLLGSTRLPAEMQSSLERIRDVR